MGSCCCCCADKIALPPPTDRAGAGRSKRRVHSWNISDELIHTYGWTATDALWCEQHVRTGFSDFQFAKQIAKRHFARRKWPWDSACAAQFVSRMMEAPVHYAMEGIDVHHECVFLQLWYDHVAPFKTTAARIDPEHMEALLPEDVRRSVKCRLDAASVATAYTDNVHSFLICYAADVGVDVVPLDGADDIARPLNNFVGPAPKCDRLDPFLTHPDVCMLQCIVLSRRVAPK